MLNLSPHSVSSSPFVHVLLRTLLAAVALLLLPAWTSAAPIARAPAKPVATRQPASPPIHIISVDSARLPPKKAFALGHSFKSFPGHPSPANSASRRFTVRWYVNPQSSMSAVLLLEFATPSSPGVIRSRTQRLDPMDTGFQSATFEVPFPDAIYWQASILVSGRLLSRLQSPNWYEIRKP